MQKQLLANLQTYTRLVELKIKKKLYFYFYFVEIPKKKPVRSRSWTEDDYVNFYQTIINCFDSLIQNNTWNMTSKELVAYKFEAWKHIPDALQKNSKLYLFE